MGAHVARWMIVVSLVAGCGSSGAGPSDAPDADVTFPTEDADGGDGSEASDAQADGAPDASPDVPDLGDAESAPDGGREADGAELDDAAPGEVDAGGASDGEVGTPEAGGDAIPEPEVTASTTLCSEPGGDRNVYDLQNPDCPDHFHPEPDGKPGKPVALDGVVVTGVFGDTFFVREPEGGPYAGIAVFTDGDPVEDLGPGDVLDVEGSYYEFYGESQIGLDGFEQIGSQEPPAPTPIAHPSHVATDGELAQLFEGGLVTVEDVATVNPQPDCPDDFGEFVVTGGLRVDDMGVEWDARIGDQFDRITGTLRYAFGNFKLEPRSEQDLVVADKGDEPVPSKCEESDCIAPKDATVTREIVINEVMVDPVGQDGPQEWIELHNPGASPVDLDGWTLRDCATQKLQLAGPDLTIEPGGYLVLGAKSNEALNGGVPVDVAWGDGFYLSNTVGSALIYDAEGTLVDQIRYQRFDPWHAFETGASMERVSPDSDGTKPESWATAEAEYGDAGNRGTPGEPNDASP